MTEGFKRFIMRSNVVEFTVAVVITDAFSPIISNLAGRMANPTIEGLSKKPSFNNIGGSHVGGATVQPGAVPIALTTLLPIAATIYLVLAFPMDELNERMVKRKGLNAKGAEISDEVRLLTEIRDVLAGGDYMNGGGTAGSSYTGGGYRQ